MSFGKLGARGGFGSLGLLGGAGVPSWVQPSAIIDEIFTTGQYYPRPIASELVDTRASSKYLTTAAGVLVPVGSNVLPISSAGMLIEPAATNLQIQSQFATGWTAVNGTNTINAAIAPDGTTTALTFTDNSTSGVHSTTPPVNPITLSAGVTYSYSYMVEPGTGRYLWLGAITTANVASGSVFDLDTGLVTVGNNGSGGGVATATFSSQLLANGWVRVICVFKFSTQTSMFGSPVAAGSATPSYTAAGQPTYIGTGKTLSIWGAQLEQGASPSSYIPTTTASVTRAADSAVVQRTGIGRVVFTFDDNSQQTVSGINTSTQFTIPTNLNRPLITRMTGYAS